MRPLLVSGAVIAERCRRWGLHKELLHQLAFYGTPNP